MVAYGASAAKKRRVSNGAVCCGAAMEGSVWEACHVVEALAPASSLVKLANIGKLIGNRLQTVYIYMCMRGIEVS